VRKNTRALCVLLSINEAFWAGSLCRQAAVKPVFLWAKTRRPEGRSPADCRPHLAGLRPLRFVLRYAALWSNGTA